MTQLIDTKRRAIIECDNVAKRAPFSARRLSSIFDGLEADTQPPVITNNNSEICWATVAATSANSMAIKVLLNSIWVVVLTATPLAVIVWSAGCFESDF